MKSRTRYLTHHTLAAVFAVGVLAMAAGTADAQGKRGPRASVASSTQCALDLDTAELVVTTTVTNKSSGDTVPETRDGGMIKAAYRRMDEKGNMVRFFPEVYQIPAGVAIPVEQSFEARFTLCDNGLPRQEVQDARTLSAGAIVEYGIAGGGGETRNVKNRCTDDPDTAENEGGIKVEDVIVDIEYACASLVP